MTGIQRYLRSGYLLSKTLGAILFSPLRTSDPGKVTQFQGTSPKILLFGYMGMGDAFMFQPALHELLEVYPDARIDLLVGFESQSRQILERLMQMEGHAFINVFEADFKSLSIGAIKRLNERLVAEHYDIVICTYMSPTPYYIDAIRSVPRRVGHSLPSSHWYKPRPNSLFNLSVRLGQDHEHETSRHFRLIAKLTGSMRVDLCKPFLTLTSEEKQYADSFWRDNGLDGRVVIGTHFGASRAQHWKKWDDARFAEVAKELKETIDPVFLHFGVASEEQQIRNAATHIESNSIHLAGKLSIFQVAALLGKCDLMLANDSGLGHVAMAVGCRAVRIFGMSDYWGYRSLTDSSTDIFKNIECSPCLQLGFLKHYNVHNCGHKNCMKLIEPSEVVASVQNLLEQR